MLAQAGFPAVTVVVKPESRRFIDPWISGRRAGDYVASAAITAVKPS